MTVSAQKNEHPMQVAMVSILVDNPVNAFKYYTEVLGFEEVLFSPEGQLAIVKSTMDSSGLNILLEPAGGMEIAEKFKKEIYAMGMPVITFGAVDIFKTVEELQTKGVVFKKQPVKTSYGYEAIFDDANGNFIQLIQLN